MLNKVPLAFSKAVPIFASFANRPNVFCNVGVKMLSTISSSPLVNFCAQNRPYVVQFDNVAKIASDMSSGAAHKVLGSPSILSNINLGNLAYNAVDNLVEKLGISVVLPVAETVTEFTADIVPSITENIVQASTVTTALSATADLSDFSDVVTGIPKLFAKDHNLGITDEMLEGVAGLFNKTTTTCVLQTRFPVIEKVCDYSYIMACETPEWLKAIFNSISQFYNKILEIAVGIYNTMSTALYFIGAALSYAWSVSSYIYNVGIHCIKEHPLITTGVVAFVVGSYIAKKCHLLDYTKTVLEVAYSGVETVTKIAYCTAVAPVYYGANKIYECCTSSSNMDCDDSVTITGLGTEFLEGYVL